MRGTEYYHTGNSTYAVNNSNFLLLNHDTEYSTHIESESEVESFTLNFSEHYTDAFFKTLVSKPADILDNNFAKATQCPRFIERLYVTDKLIYPFVGKIYNRLPHFCQLNDEVAELFAGLFAAMLQHHAAIDAEIDTIHKTKLSTRQELYRRLNYARIL